MLLGQAKGRRELGDRRRLAHARRSDQGHGLGTPAVRGRCDGAATAPETCDRLGQTVCHFGLGLGPLAVQPGEDLTGQGGIEILLEQEIVDPVLCGTPCALAGKRRLETRHCGLDFLRDITHGALDRLRHGLFDLLRQ